MAGLSRLVIVMALIALTTLGLVACRHRVPVVIVLPGPVVHEIGHWAEDDLVCVALPARQSLYVPRRCVPMGTIRALILQTQRAGAGDSASLTSSAR